MTDGRNESLKTTFPAIPREKWTVAMAPTGRGLHFPERPAKRGLRLERVPVDYVSRSAARGIARDEANGRGLHFPTRPARRRQRPAEGVPMRELRT